MKKICILLLLGVLLTGCKERGEMETVMDQVLIPERPAAQQMSFYIPDDAAAEVFATEGSRQIYFCEDFVLTSEIRESGDLHKTMEEITGFEYDQLSVMETKKQNITRYDCVWTVMGENGEEVGRCAVLDDGGYHYILTAFAPSDKAGELTDSIWNDMFSSYCLYAPGEIIDSGS